ncbi:MULTISPECIES: hypothetical protein [Caulobacter]|jgi:hypothetical protein|uniref:Uncharacterized protein n=1 Tax=Caulobacter vibrioides OR37 TaxID=1292034 RepID=R0CWL6_CAUVI|nr:MULTISPECIES: hypothetical protein [Caulobacter]ENZ80911.1 hypothetical protein OR37_03186 [Caulobacter vibrioides OR37]MBQ1561577.1 hypothetical protein [Caulobacter sp.]
MSLKQRLRALTGRQWLTFFAASILLSLGGQLLTDAWTPFAISPIAKALLGAFVFTSRVLPALVVGAAAGSGSLTLPRK